MKNIMVQTVAGKKLETVYNNKELPLLYYLIGAKESKKRDIVYYDIPMAFDIETTNIFQRTEAGNINPAFRPYSFMYHWQLCIMDRVVFGRTWEEFIDLMDKIRAGMNLNNKHRVVIWVHNLAFESQFMLPFLKLIDGFWKEERKPLKLVIDGGLEFRCSLSLSNMNLDKFTKNEKAVYRKNSGEAYDYNKIRYPWTPMTETEESYCYCDVRGLCECISNYLRHDTLASMPLTSTGFIRREARAEMRKNEKNREIFTSSALNEKTYKLCKSAFRGGDTHGNAAYADHVIHDVYSYDISSSYPAALLMETYPLGRFTRISNKRFLSNSWRGKMRCILTLILKNPIYRGKCGNPYISYSKCSGMHYDFDEHGHIKRPIIDNGRVARFFGIITLDITDIDYDIIMSEYSFDRAWISNAYAAGAGYLPEELRSYIIERFRKKTALKGVSGMEYEYMREKNKINGIYGMMVTAIDNENISYNQASGEWFHDTAPLSEQLQKYYKSRNSFLSYQWGVFCTAHARAKLRRMLNKVGRDVIYCDTDSIKFINSRHIQEFENENEKLKESALKLNAFADDSKGNRHYMGIWEFDGHYAEFKHLGAKRYIVKYEGDDNYYTTIAGVRKDRGKEHFTNVGIERFRNGETIKNAGHLVAYYNDYGIHSHIVGTRHFTSASNVTLVDDTYTLGITDEYLDFMRVARENACMMDYE